MKLRIFTENMLLEDVEVGSVTLPGAAGQLTPMAGHDLLLTPLKMGVLYFRPVVDGAAGDKKQYRISEGLAEIRKDCISVFAGNVEKITTDQSR